MNLGEQLAQQRIRIGFGDFDIGKRADLGTLAGKVDDATDIGLAGHLAGKLTFPFDKKVLASRLGMAPEVLSRCFASLAAYDVVVQGPSVRINDFDVLRKLAQPSPTIDDVEY